MQAVRKRIFPETQHANLLQSRMLCNRVERKEHEEKQSNGFAALSSSVKTRIAN